MSAPTPVAFLGVVSAEATISQLRQTRIQPSVIHLINLLLDEIISSLIASAGSINPTDLRINAVPQVFSAGNNGPESTGIKSLARECTAEAELEVRSWHEINPGAKRGFPPGTKGRGMSASKEQAAVAFPVDKAVDLMRIRISELSGYSPPVDNFDAIDEIVVAAWKAAGGDVSPSTIEPASAWLHAFVERICEKLLAQLNRVVERDSSIAICGPHDLYTALAEDERFWGWFARMKVKTSLDEAMKAASKPLKLRNDLGSGRSTPPDTHVRSSPIRDDHLDSRRKASSSPISSSPARGSSEASRLAGLASVTRKGSAITKRFGTGHDRKDSVLSVSSRGARSDADEVGRAKSPQDDEDEFDALVRSGETMKVSLTPSRLKTFEAPASGKKGLPNSPSLNQNENRQNNVFGTTEPVPPVPRNGHNPLVTPTSSPARPVNGGSSLPGSGQKLVARAATTIEERGDEEGDSLPSKQAKKESLKELLDSNPEDYATQPSGKRTVPAVILASPPPRPPTQIEPVEASVSAYAALARRPSSGSTDRASDGVATRRADRRAERDDRLAARRRPRTEARELADFFSSVPPPSPPESRSIDPPPSSAKSVKGFRGLMSKVTGTGSKKKEEEARIARENAAWEIPTAPRAPITRHKKAVGSVSTTGTASPMSFRPNGEEMPDLPAKLRKRQDAGANGGGSSRTPSEKSAVSRQASLTTINHSAQSNEPSALSSKPTHPKPPLGVFSAVEGASKTPPNIPVRMPQLEGVRLRQEQHYERPERQAEGPAREIPAEVSIPSQAVSILNTDTKPQPEGTGAGDSNLSTPADVSPAQRQGEHGSRSVSDANSFKTAPEGDSGAEDNAASERTESPASQTGLGTEVVEANGSDTAQQASSTSPEPSVTLARLALARSLLRHATTADECRMLLDAYLIQIGVPRHAGDDGLADLTGEAKVVAWLLDGQPGPAFRWPYSPLASASTDGSRLANRIEEAPGASRIGLVNGEKEEEESEQSTPKLTAAPGGELDEVDQLATEAEGNEEEELISETDSSASVVHEDDGSLVSVATSGTRSPVRLSTLGPVSR